MGVALKKQAAYSINPIGILKAGIKESVSIIVELFSWLDNSQHDQALFPPDFLEFVFRAAQRLQESGRVNILYLFAKRLATMRPDGSVFFTWQRHYQFLTISQDFRG